VTQAKWKEIAELVGISAIVASLIFVGVQLKQDRDLAIAEASIASFSHMLEIRDQQFEYIEIWNSGNAGLELTADQRAIYRGLIVGAHQSAFMVWSSLDRAGLASVEFAVSDFAGFLYRNPAARLEWETHVNEIGSFRELPGEDFQRNTNWEDSVRKRIKEIGEAYD
jgi:hypothetical protein